MANDRQLLQIPGGYKIDFFAELGRGSFGTVYRGYDREQKNIAIKKISRDEVGRRNASSEAAKLNHLMTQVGRQKNILSIFEIIYFQRAIYIITELCDLGDLNKWYRSSATNADLTLQFVHFIRQIMKGISYLHRCNIVHRDVKPENILVKSSQQRLIIKLADFGLCKILAERNSSTVSSNVGTRAFMAPEFWTNSVRYHMDVDVYAAGLTFTAMLQAKPGSRLIPKPEGSLQPSEENVFIGS